MKKLLTVMVVGSIGLVLVETMVLGLGVRTSATLALLSLVNVVIALGIWGLHNAAPAEGGLGKLASIGVALTSIGLLILAAPPWPVARSYDLELGQVIRDSTLYQGALIAATVGLVLFGIAQFRAPGFARWAIVTLIVGPPITMLITLNDGPLLVANLAGLAVALALTSMALASSAQTTSARTVGGSAGDSAGASPAAT